MWERFRNGDSSAFSQIYHLHVLALFQYGSKLSPDAAFVMDCIHDLFIDLNNYRKNIGATDNIRFYLIRSLKHKILRNLKGRHKTRNDDIDNHPFLLEAAFDEQQDELDAVKQKRRRLRDIINKLPDRQKEIIYLRYINDFTNEEIVRIMGINYQAVRNMLHKAIENLRKNISKEDFILFVATIKRLRSE